MNYYERIYTNPDGTTPIGWNKKQINKFKNNNMETKKKINWLKIWQIIRDLLVAILTGDAIANKI